MKAASLMFSAAVCAAASGEVSQLGILTPPERPEPRICGPSVFGVRPGSPFWYRVPATGEKPLAVEVDIPDGAEKSFSFDPVRRVLEGVADRPGEIEFVFRAKNGRGSAERKFTLRAGAALALTPPMGWNSWNSLGSKVSQEAVARAADALVESGLADHGWIYVNIDDHWQEAPENGRAPDGSIRPNGRFTDMRALAERIHSLGLRAGLYSSPGEDTCGGCAGSWRHEAQDAATYADWGFDLLKYDWCQYGKIAPGRGWQRDVIPYRLMGGLLAAQKRDIVFSMCQYGRAFVATWGKSAGGHCWRVSGDLFDSWTDVLRQLRALEGLEMFAGPGAWNDPDMLVVGRMRDFSAAAAPGDASAMRQTRLTPNEQYSHVSLWALCAAPLLIGADLETLLPAARPSRVRDDFTYSLLSNDEVIDIDQDPLGKAAGRVEADADSEVWARPLSDGSVAAGLFNTSGADGKVSFDMAGCGMDGRWRVRDVWRQRDEGIAEGRIERAVPAHATHLVRFFPLAGASLRCDPREREWRRIAARPDSRP